MYERFTKRSRLVMSLASQFAELRGHKLVETDDVLLALIREGQGIAGCVLKGFGVDLSKFDIDLTLLSECESKRALSLSVKRLLEFAIQEACWLRHSFVGTEHLMLGLCRDVQCDGAKVLLNMDVDPGDVGKGVFDLLGHGPEEWERFH